MIFSSERLSVHHIGGRPTGGGTRAFPVLREFEKDIINVLYEADADCIEGIRQVYQHVESELHVLPYCLGNACGPASFNINHNPCTSSLLESNPDYHSYYACVGNSDDIWSEGTTLAEKRHIEMVTIDHVFRSATATAPPPDFLSIDTQGSEYEILQGAKETLQSSVLALVIEAEFHPIYEGQRLFGDLAKLLSDRGFHFVRFLGLAEMSPFRAPVGLRGEGFHVSTEALFLRRIDNLESQGDELRRYFMLRKLAFIAIVFNQFEYALECLRRSKDLVTHDSEVPEEPVYLRFLGELEKRVERMPKVYPPILSFQRNAGTSTTGMAMVNMTGKIHRIKQALRQIPIIVFVYSFLYLLPKRVLPKLFYYVRSNLAGYTDIEAVLIEYGLEAQANMLRRKRII